MGSSTICPLQLRSITKPTAIIQTSGMPECFPSSSIARDEQLAERSLTSLRGVETYCQNLKDKRYSVSISIPEHLAGKRRPCSSSKIGTALELLTSSQTALSVISISTTLSFQRAPSIYTRGIKLKTHYIVVMRVQRNDVYFKALHQECIMQDLGWSCHQVLMASGCPKRLLA